MNSPIPRAVRLGLPKLKGDHPPFNEWTRWAVDHDAQQVYVYGGCRPGDSSEENATNDFYVLDMQNNSFTWKNLNDSLHYRTSAPNQEVINRPFPALRQPGMTFSIVDGRKFLFLFGGYLDEEKRATSDLIAVDPVSKDWFHVSMEGGSVTPRMDAAITIMGTQLFIFGGRLDDDTVISSFSIAKYSDHWKWRWTHIDIRYPVKVNLGYKMGAIPLPEIGEILLFPGRLACGSDELFKINKSRVLTFSVEDHSFTRLRKIPADHFPGQVNCYDALLFQNNPSASNLIIIAGWVCFDDPDDDVGYIVPELWICDPSPEGQCMERLRLRKVMFDLDRDLKIAITCRNRVFVFGYNHGDGEQYVDPPPGATWNYCVEVKLGPKA